jgi:transcription elongation GreA/GreB family factor
MSSADYGPTSPCTLVLAPQTRASSMSRCSRPPVDWTSSLRCSMPLRRSTKPDRAVIGRRVTLLEEDGDSVTYGLVFPGDGDPIQGWISADSPLGAAVLGCAPGDRVEVDAPVGRRVVTVLSVE